MCLRDEKKTCMSTISGLCGHGPAVDSGQWWHSPATVIRSRVPGEGGHHYKYMTWAGWRWLLPWLEWMDGSPFPTCTETLRDMNLVGNCLLYMTRKAFVSFVKSHKEIQKGPRLWYWELICSNCASVHGWYEVSQCCLPGLVLLYLLFWCQECKHKLKKGSFERWPFCFW